MIMPEKVRRFGRRTALKAGFTFLTLLSCSNIPLLNESLTREESPKKLFLPQQYGVNYLPDKESHYGLNPDEVLDYQLSLPSSNFRLGLRFSDIYQNSDRGDFDEYDRVVDKIKKAGKTIHWQMGIKTFGRHEVNIPERWYERFPYLRSHGAQLDRDSAFRELILQKLIEVGEHFLPQDEEGSLQIENEPRVRVFDGRYISSDFNDQEIDLVKSIDRSSNRKIVQNVSWDHPESIQGVLNNPRVDIIGLNVYNNIYPELINLGFWKYYEWIFAQAAKRSKGVYVLEYQLAPWVDYDMNAVYHFSSQRRLDGLIRLQQMSPDIIFGWDHAQLLARAQRGESDSRQFLDDERLLVGA